MSEDGRDFVLSLIGVLLLSAGVDDVIRGLLGA